MKKADLLCLENLKKCVGIAEKKAWVAHQDRLQSRG